MNRYKVVGPFVNVHSGVLSLTAEQAAARAAMVKANTEGNYEIVRTAQFKRGESFGYDGVISKEFVDEVVDENKPETKRRKPWRS